MRARGASYCGHESRVNPEARDLSSVDVQIQSTRAIVRKGSRMTFRAAARTLCQLRLARTRRLTRREVQSDPFARNSTRVVFRFTGKRTRAVRVGSNLSDAWPATNC